MRLVYFNVGPGHCMMATEVHDCTGMSDDDLDKMAWELAVQQTESYGSFYLEGNLPEEDEDDSNDYFTDSDLSYHWEEYYPEKHDMYRCGGGSFLDEFKVRDY